MQVAVLLRGGDLAAALQMAEAIRFAVLRADWVGLGLAGQVVTVSIGVGLGLSVARGFVEAMGGTIASTDTPGGGLTIEIDLAAAPDVGAP